MKYLPIQKLHSSVLIMLIGIFFLTSLGCSSKQGRTVVFSKPAVDFDTILYKPWDPAKKVCVLPFDNISKESDADIKVMEIFLTELFSAGIFEDIVDPIQANAALLGMRIRKPNSLDKETIKALGERLAVPYLILGTVTDYEYGKNKGSASQVGLSVRMIDVDTGNILWTGNCYKNGDKSTGRIFGFTDGPNPSDLSKEICENIISSLKSQIQRSSRARSSWKAERQHENIPKKIVTTEGDPEEKRR